MLGLIIVGIPLEMSHPTSRVAAVYFLGVIGGALGSSVITSDKRPLTGASGMDGEKERQRDRDRERRRDGEKERQRDAEKQRQRDGKTERRRD